MPRKKEVEKKAAKKIEKVAIVRCKNYNKKNVNKAIKKILKLLDFDTKKYKKILIKPNLLGAYKENQIAITTNPSLVKAICKQFRGEKFIGESSFMHTEKAIKGAGYSGFKNFIVFEENKLVKIRDKKARILKSFYLPAIVKKADLIVSVSKLKTHSLTKMTGAIKNLYGCIPGGMKQLLHKKAIGDKKFSSMLIDICQNINPKLNIMDAVIGMEGEGPSAGRPKKVGLILASKNAIALDIAAAQIMGYSPKRILVIRQAIKRKLYPGYTIEVVGDIKEFRNLKFDKSSSSKKQLIKAALRRFVKDNPIAVNKEKCIKCGSCAKKCPAKAINLEPYPVINVRKCIRCFCCIEVCPRHALSLKETRLRRLVRKMRERRKSRFKKR